jgi:hypothetical protein
MTEEEIKSLDEILLKIRDQAISGGATQILVALKNEHRFYWIMRRGIHMPLGPELHTTAHYEEFEEVAKNLRAVHSQCNTK